MATEELIDIIDDDGNLTGRILPRSVVHKTGLRHRTVHIWICNAKGDLLLQRRALVKESFPGLWDISAAGHISAGDTSIKAAVRELKEELGIDARENEFRFVFTIKGLYENHAAGFYDHELSDVYLLTKEITPADCKLAPEETMAVQWYTLQDLKMALENTPELFVPHHEAYEKLFRLLNR